MRYTVFLHDPERHPGRSRLYDLASDPRQQWDVLSAEMAVGRAFQRCALQALEGTEADEQTLGTVRRGLAL